MKIMRIGVDLAKNVFRVHGVDRAEKPVWCRHSSPGLNGQKGSQIAVGHPRMDFTA
jgi:hypothetical protein